MFTYELNSNTIEIILFTIYMCQISTGYIFSLIESNINKKVKMVSLEVIDIKFIKINVCFTYRLKNIIPIYARFFLLKMVHGVERGFKQGIEIFRYPH